MNNKIGFYVFTTYKNHDRCSFIEETWGQDQDLYFFTDKIVKNPNYIACTHLNTYISHIYKNFYAIDYANIKHKDKYDWFVFIGDDTFYYTQNLTTKLKDLDPLDNKVYGEVSNCWDFDKSLYYVLGGGGIIFNKTSLQNFTDSKYDLNYLSQTGYSDVAIGIVCRNNNIVLKNFPGIYSQKPDFYNIANAEQHVAFHYIKTKEEFHSLYKNTL